MQPESSLQPLWDWILNHVGVAGVASPAFLFTMVVAGVYLPGIVFSFVDVVITRRLTVRAGTAPRRRAAWGANTRWYRSRFTRGFGVNAASRPRKSSGPASSARVPSRHGRRSSRRTRPSGAIDRESWAIGGRRT